jgi:hypothetical protein
MRTNDPVMLQQIQQLEQIAEALRRICGFPPLVELPETTASRKPRYECALCTRMTFSREDFDAHMRIDHPELAGATASPARC